MYKRIVKPTERFLSESNGGVHYSHFILKNSVKQIVINCSHGINIDNMNHPYKQITNRINLFEVIKDRLINSDNYTAFVYLDMLYFNLKITNDVKLQFELRINRPLSYKQTKSLLSDLIDKILTFDKIANVDYFKPYTAKWGVYNRNVIRYPDIKRIIKSYEIVSNINPHDVSVSRSQVTEFRNIITNHHGQVIDHKGARIPTRNKMMWNDEVNNIDIFEDCGLKIGHVNVSFETMVKYLNLTKTYDDILTKIEMFKLSHL